MGNLEQELLGIWEDSGGDGDGWSGEKRGRQARGGGAAGDFRRRGGDGGGAISRAVSDENLFDSLFGDQRGGDEGGGGGGASELAGNLFVDSSFTATFEASVPSLGGLT